MSTPPLPTLESSIAAWPSLDVARRDHIVKTGGKLAELWEASPIRIESNDNRCEEVVDALFPGNPLLCVAKSHIQFDTKPREQWRGELAQMQLIVPSPMTSRTGRTQNGKRSAHSLSNCGPRKYLVAAFSTGNLDSDAALVQHLAIGAPLALVVQNGDKGLDAWFLMQHYRPESQLQWFRHAVALGANASMWSRSAWARLPEGTSEAGKKHAVSFLDHTPKVLKPL